MFTVRVLTLSCGFLGLVLHAALVGECAFAAAAVAGNEAQIPIFNAAQAQAENLMHQGDRLHASGQFGPALQAWHSAQGLFESAGDRSGTARAMAKSGAVLVETGRYDEGIDRLDDALAAAQSAGEPRAELIASLWLGHAHFAFSRNSLAVGHYQRALALARGAENAGDETESLLGLSGALHATGRYESALAAASEALAIARRRGDVDSECSALIGIASVHGNLGRPAQAADYFRQCLALAQANRILALEIVAETGLARAYMEQDRDELALDAYQKSLKTSQQQRYVQGEQLVQNGLGRYYHKVGKLEKSRRAHERSLQLARALNNKTAEANALLGLGAVQMAAENFDAAEAYFSQGVQLAWSLDNLVTLGTALNSLGAAQSRQGKLVDAGRNLSTAVRAYESARARLSDFNRVTLLDVQQGTYRLLQDVWVRQERPEQALEISERGRAQALRLLLAERHGNPPDTGQQAEKFSIDRIRQIAREQRSVLVEYSIVGPDDDPERQELFIWVVQPTGDIRFRKTALGAIGQPLPDLVSAARAAIGVRGTPLASARRGPPLSGTPGDSHADRLGTLYELLIAPVRDLLPPDPQVPLIVVPQGPLFMVPFAAIRDPGGRDLIDDHTLVTAPSLRLAGSRRVRMTSGADSGSSALVVGNPTMPSIRMAPGEASVVLPQLPGTLVEAENIARIVGADLLTGPSATETEVVKRLPRSPIVHLATHGLLDDLGSGVPGLIALAPSSTDDGLLTATELLDLELSADLVVLSACDTGRGRITGDGVIGLSRSLLAAGAASTLVTLWQVPDEPTAYLMIEFYRELAAGLDKAGALRTAMLRTRDRYREPGNWAGFVLIGDTAAVHLHKKLSH